MIIVTGGAGFIGSRLVMGLNQQGREDILVVDDLSDGQKFVNLAPCRILDYLDKKEFLTLIQQNKTFAHNIDALFHQGACSTTTEWDGRYMMENNFTYSKDLLHYCLDRQIPFLFASSASVYGTNTTFKEEPAYEEPLNVYAYSKLLFDQYVRRLMPHATSQVVGLRYFNVYGPHEQHKGAMASVAYHFSQQIRQAGVAKLFAASGGYDAGEQRRDFVYVDDVVDVNLWFFTHREHSGIFNVGTGRSQTFNDVANAIINREQQGTIEYIPFPDKLRNCYQSFTQADIRALRAIGYEAEFKTVAAGIETYRG